MVSNLELPTVLMYFLTTAIKKTEGSGEPMSLAVLFFLVLHFWYVMAIKEWTQAVVTDCDMDRPHSLSSHAFCGTVSQRSASQKRRCIMGPALWCVPL